MHIKNMEKTRFLLNSIPRKPLVKMSKFTINKLFKTEEKIGKEYLPSAWQ